MNINIQAGSSISINGREYRGSNISIVGDKVIIDGIEQDGQLQPGPITVAVIGEVKDLHLGAGKVEISGNVGSVGTQSGDVTCGEVRGSVSTMSGDVHCGSVSGGVKTMSGDITTGGC